MTNFIVSCGGRFILHKPFSILPPTVHQKLVGADIIRPQTTKTWEYNDGTWSDLLTNFNGETITYDEIGNPLTMDECMEVVIPIYNDEETDITGGTLYFHSFKNPSDWPYHNDYEQVYIDGTEGFWFYK